MARECRNCRFYEASDESDGSAECRRYPPSHTKPEDDILEPKWFPRTYRDSWCGEWRQSRDD